MYSQTTKILDQKQLSVTTHRYGPFAVDRYDTMAVQWGLFSAAGVGTVRIYSSLATDKREVTELDPAVNAAWAPVPDPFPSQPNGAIDSEIGPISGTPGHWLMIEIEITTQAEKFSLWFEGKGAN